MLGWILNPISDVMFKYIRIGLKIVGILREGGEGVRVVERIAAWYLY